MISRISRSLLVRPLIQNKQKFSNYLDKSNFIQAKLDAEVSPPASQLNKHYYNPEYRYETSDEDIMRLYTEKDNSTADVTWTDVLDSAYINVRVF